PVGKAVGPDQVAATDLHRIDPEPLGQQVHHALRLEVEMGARVAAVGPGQALVRHDDGGVDLQVLEAVGADEVAGRTEAATRLRTTDVAADVVVPLEPHPDDGAVAAGGDLPPGHPIGAAGGGQQVLAPVLDPLHRHAELHRGQADQRQ